MVISFAGMLQRDRLPEINNDDDYIEALKKMKESLSETEDGLPVYAMSAYNDPMIPTLTSTKAAAWLRLHQPRR